MTHDLRKPDGQDDSTTAAWRDAADRQFARNRKHLIWGSMFFCGLVTLVAFGTPSVAEGQHGIVRLLASLAVGAGVTAAFAGMGWLIARGSRWGSLLPMRIQRWVRRRF